MDERLCVVMPVYNEQDAIGGVLAKWDAALKTLGIDFVIRPYNDGSKDKSLEVMREFVATHADSRVEVRDKPNGGHGNTILTGYREAAKDGFDWVFQIDSDDEMGPEKFNELWSRRNDYDFLVGIRDGRVQALPRKIISFVSRLCVRIFYGKSVWDVNTPYRLMRVSAFKPFYDAIPLTTFAPNVILSGLAARHMLRSFETRVPQHDRTTGEVSIKKWKLLKAAAKSFWQTIVFSFKGAEGSLIGLLLGTVLCTATILSLDYISFPWCDEVGTTDTAASVVLHGVWRSHLWHYSYNPLHINLLVGWIKVFGVSHMSVCAFGVFTGYVLFVVLGQIMARNRILEGVGINVLYAVLFWGGSGLMTILTNGRIDMLTALFTVLTVNELMRKGVVRSYRLFVYSFLMMLSAVYQVPVVMIFGLCLLVCAETKEDRKIVWRKGWIAAVGVALAFGVSCGYYVYHRQLIRFLHTYFSFNATLSGSNVGFVKKVVDGYTYDMQALWMFALVAVALLVVSRLRKDAWRLVFFIGLIPLLAKYSGRYESYYSWMFYLPVLVVFLWAIRRMEKRWIVYAVLVLTFISTVWRIANQVSFWTRMHALQVGAEREVSERAGELYPGCPVILSDFRYYYPLLRHGAEIWAAQTEVKDISPEEKFLRFVDKYTQDEETRERAIRLYRRFERPYYSTAPANALVF